MDQWIGIAKRKRSIGTSCAPIVLFIVCCTKRQGKQHWRDNALRSASRYYAARVV